MSDSGASCDNGAGAPSTRTGRAWSGGKPARRRPAEGPLWMLAGLVAAGLMTWPLVRHLSSTVPHSTADPLAQAWHVAWGGHALLNQPLDVFDANAFWPAGPSLAFADSMLGYAPAALVGSGPTAALVRYNLLFVFAYALVFAAGGLLARELGLRVPAAVVVATGAAFSPTRIMQNNHLNVLSVGGIFLALFLLISGYRRRRRWQVVAGWLVATWQMSIGFAMGIWFAYLLALLAAVASAVWWWRGRPAVPREVVLPSVFGIVVLGGTVLLLLQPYLQVLAQYPQAASRDYAEVEFYSPPPRALLAASGESRLWGDRTSTIRSTLSWPTEQAVFPGVIIVVLAAVGLRWRGARRGLRIGLFVLGGITLLLSLGPRLEAGVLYEGLYRWAPGWENIRTPGRLAFLWSFVLALLGGMGAQRIWERVRHNRNLRQAWRAPAATATVLALAALVAFEGAMRLPLVPVGSPPVALSRLEQPQLHLPSDFYQDPHYMLWSAEGFPLIANGAGSFDPPELVELRSLHGFPDAGSVEVLRQRGIQTVVVHRRNVGGTPWEAGLLRPVAQLGIERTDLAGAVVFDLFPERT